MATFKEQYPFKIIFDSAYIHDADMKILYLFLLVVPITLLSANFADPIDSTAELIRQGNIHELAKTFSSTVDLTVMDDENSYSSTQAETAISDFFKKNQPRTVKIFHRIDSNPNYRFGVLMVATTNGDYRVAFSLRKINSRFELNELRIEAEKTK